MGPPKFASEKHAALNPSLRYCRDLAFELLFQHFALPEGITSG